MTPENLLRHVRSLLSWLGASGVKRADDELTTASRQHDKPTPVCRTTEVKGRASCLQPSLLHRKNVSFSSSIAAHPDRLKLAHTAIEASATRAQARIAQCI